MGNRRLRSIGLEINVWFCFKGLGDDVDDQVQMNIIKRRVFEVQKRGSSCKNVNCFILVLEPILLY